MYVVSGEEFTLKGPGEFVVTRQGVKADEGGGACQPRPGGQRASAAVLVQTSKAATASLRMRSAPGAQGRARRAPTIPSGAKIAHAPADAALGGRRRTPPTRWS